MSSAWIFQEAADVRDLGADKAPWQVGWYEPSGKRKKKSFGPGFMGQKRAERFKNKTENALMDGSYQMDIRKTWEEFVAEYDRRILAGKAARTRVEALAALDSFQRIVKPVRVLAIGAQHIDDYIAARRQEPGKRAGDPISPATVNKSLRHIKAALKKARKWGYLHNAPDVDFEKEPGKIPTYIPPEHFATLYQAADQAKLPERLPYPAADWWRGLLVTCYMTGWRIGQLLALKRTDVDLDAGTAMSWAKDNKGKRDQLINLHPLVVQHLRKLPCLDPRFFPWNYRRETIFEEFNRIQDAAGVKPGGRKGHYGFHDLRRAFATMNADRLTADQLQLLMQHKSYTTTQGYINMARQMNPAVQNLYVPDLTRKAGNA